MGAQPTATAGCPSYPSGRFRHCFGNDTGFSELAFLSEVEETGCRGAHPTATANIRQLVPLILGQIWQPVQGS